MTRTIACILANTQRCSCLRYVRGQRRPVTVTKFVMKDSVERRVHDFVTSSPAFTAARDKLATAADAHDAAEAAAKAAAAAAANKRQRYRRGLVPTPAGVTAKVQKQGRMIIFPS